MASKGVNHAIIVGNLGNDPDMRHMPNGNAVTNISVATSESWNDKNTGQAQERTEWHKIIAYGKLAEIMGEYLRKGSQVYIEGRIQTRKWQDQSGNDRYSTEIIADQMQMLGGRGDGQGNQQQSAPQQQAQQFSAPQQDEDDFSDSIPF